MIAYKSWASLVVIFLCAAAGSHVVANRISAHMSRNKPVVKEECPFSHASLSLAGKHLDVEMVDVTYGPGEFSQPHSHPCPVIGYVLEGAVRVGLKDRSETIYQAGDGFYEGPNRIHLVSGNASSEEPARFLAYFVCNHETRLSLVEPQTVGGQQS